MHELSIAENILSITEEYAAREEATRIHAIDLEIGTLAGIEIDALEFAMEAVFRDTLLGAAKITIESIQAKGRCLTCSHEFEAEDFFSPCPDCNDFDIDIVSGTELKVKALHID